MCTWTHVLLVIAFWKWHIILLLYLRKYMCRVLRGTNYEMYIRACIYTLRTSIYYIYIYTHRSLGVILFAIKQLTSLFRLLLFWFYRCVKTCFVHMCYKTNRWSHHTRPLPSGYLTICISWPFETRHWLPNHRLPPWHRHHYRYCCFDLQMTVYFLSHLSSVVSERAAHSHGELATAREVGQSCRPSTWHGYTARYNIWSNCPGRHAN